MHTKDVVVKIKQTHNANISKKRDEFENKVSCRCKAYSSLTVINVKIDDLLRYLADCWGDYEIYDGSITGNSIQFDIQTGDLYGVAKELSLALNCVCFADTSWDEHAFYAFKCGVFYDNFTCEWEAAEPTPYTEDTDEDTVYYDCDLVATDKSSKTKHYFGGGMCTENEFLNFKKLVSKH